MAKKNKGPFLPVDRSFFESELWTRGPFTPAMAWLDLNYLAAYEDTSVIFKGKRYDLKRGQLITSSGILAKRWNLNVDQVKRLLAHYKATHACTTERTTTGTTITIENYPNFELSRPRGALQTPHEPPTERTTNAPRDALSSIYTRSEEKRNKETENDFSSGPKIISEFRDPKTGEERVIIRP